MAGLGWPETMRVNILLKDVTRQFHDVRVEIRTRVARARIRRANHYTTAPRHLSPFLGVVCYIYVTLEDYPRTIWIMKLYECHEQIQLRFI